jgi:hypothetical protein
MTIPETSPVAETGARILQFFEYFDAGLAVAGFDHAARMRIAGLLWSFPRIGQPADATGSGRARSNGLTADEVAFVMRVLSNPGGRLGDLAGNSPWTAPEQAGLVVSTGSWKWQPTGTLMALLEGAVSARNPSGAIPASDVGAAVVLPGQNEAGLSACPCCRYTGPEVSDTATAGLMPASVAVLSLVRCPANAGGCGMQSGWYETDAEAVAAWNRCGGGLEMESRSQLLSDLGRVVALIHDAASGLDARLSMALNTAMELIARTPMVGVQLDSRVLTNLIENVQQAAREERNDGDAVARLVSAVQAFGAEERTLGYAKKVANAECGALAMLDLERQRADAAEAKLSALQHQLEQRPAPPGFLKLVREYGNVPVIGPGRTSSWVFAEICAAAGFATPEPTTAAACTQSCPTDDEIIAILTGRSMLATYVIRNFLATKHRGISTSKVRSHLRKMEAAEKIVLAPSSNERQLCWTLSPKWLIQNVMSLGSGSAHECVSQQGR